jgi:hypothetical protein
VGEGGESEYLLNNEVISHMWKTDNQYNENKATFEYIKYLNLFS